jgi:hypothetical protein
VQVSRKHRRTAPASHAVTPWAQAGVESAR